MFHDGDAAGGLDDYNLYISQKDGFEHIQASSHYSLSNAGQSRPPVLAHKPLFDNFFSSCFFARLLFWLRTFRTVHHSVNFTAIFICKSYCISVVLIKNYASNAKCE